MTTAVRPALLALLGLGLLAGLGVAQSLAEPAGRNLGFDDAPPSAGIPSGWDDPTALPPSGGRAYDLATVSAARDGQASARLRFVGPGSDDGLDFGVFTQAVDATPFRGRRVRLSGWLRGEAIEAGGGLWLRVDAADGLRAFDNMSDRFLTGDSDWSAHSLVHDVAADADRLAFGLLLMGRGTLWADSLRLEVVGDDVETTTLWAPEPFDDRPADDHVVDWIRRHAVTLKDLDDGNPASRLRPFARTLDGRVVGLGLAAHGTHEPHLLRQRLVQLLVEEGRTALVALDVDAASGLYIDQWVRRGRGDPRVELSALSDWSWRYEEVLDLLLWLRNWNRGAPSDRRVRVAGIDGRELAGSLTLAAAYVERVDGERADDYAAAMAPLLAAEREHRKASDAELETATRTVAELLARFDARRVPWSGMTSPKAWHRGRHLVELTGQAVALQGGAHEGAAVFASSRADNVQWLLDTLGDGERMVVLGHNESLALQPLGEQPNLGHELQRRLGAAFLSVGASFGQGALRARDGRSLELRAYRVAPDPPGSLGHTLGRAHDGPLLLDLRGAPPAGPVQAWLDQRHRQRSVGHWYSEHAAPIFSPPRRLSDHFHAIMHVPETSLATPLVEP